MCRKWEEYVVLWIRCAARWASNHSSNSYLSCVILAQILNPSEPQFTHMFNRDKITYLSGLL